MGDEGGVLITVKEVVLVLWSFLPCYLRFMEICLANTLDSCILWHCMANWERLYTRCHKGRQMNLHEGFGYCSLL